MWRVAAVSCSTCVCLLSCWDCAGIVQVGVCSKVIPFTNSDYGVGDFDTSWGWCIYRAQRFHGDGGRNVSQAVCVFRVRSLFSGGGMFRGRCVMCVWLCE